MNCAPLRGDLEKLGDRVGQFPLCGTERLTELGSPSYACDYRRSFESLLESFGTGDEGGRSMQAGAKFFRCSCPTNDGGEPRDAFHHLSFEHLAVRGRQQAVATAESQVQRALGDARSFHQVFDAKPALAVLLQQLDGDVDNLVEIRNSSQRTLALLGGHALKAIARPRFGPRK